MYCPVCKEEHSGKFCPECGTRLVAEHVKSAGKLQSEWNERFIKFGKDVLAEGLGVEKENGEQETVCQGTGASGAARPDGNARSASDSGVTSLSRRDSVLMSAVERNIDSNNAEALEKQIERLAVLVSNYSVDVVSYKYYMLLATLRPKELISLYEANTTNGYWRTFWVAVAYLKCNDICKTDKAIVRLDCYSEYPEDNSLLLSALRAYAESLTYEAEEYMNEIIWNECTPLLLPFVKAASLVIAPERAVGIAVDNGKCKFYIENILCLNTPEEKEDRSVDELSKPELIPIVDSKGKWGYVDADDKEVIPCKYDYAYPFYKGFARVKLDNRWGLIDESGRGIIPCKYDFVNGFSEGLAPLQLSGKYGYIDKRGREAIPCRYDIATDFHEGVAAVLSRYKWGLIDKSGKQVLPCKYDEIRTFFDGLAGVRQGTKWGYIDKSGKEVISCEYDFLSPFFEGLAVAGQDRKYGFIDKNGIRIIPFVFRDAYFFSEGLAPVKLNAKWGYIDKSGKEVIPCEFYRASTFFEGLAAVSLNRKWGYIDKSGKEVVNIVYDNAQDFQEGLAAVSLNGKWGYIDKSGKGIIPFKYDSTYRFFEGLALVHLNGKEFYIDKTGKEYIKD